MHGQLSRLPPDNGGVTPMSERTETAVETTAPAIRAEVSRILNSEAFVRSRRMQRFLAFIVEETLAGRAEQIGEYAIGVAVFDRGEDFDPAVDPIVRNDARRLRLKLLEYYGQPQPRAIGQVVIDIPKGGYVPTFVGSQPREASDVVPTESPRRLAVLPFEVLSEAPDGAMYGRALCMSLTANLTSVHGLETVAHDYLREMPIREAASELRLSHIIQGCILRSRERCRIVVNLVHISNGTQLWAREYDFDNREILAAHAEVIRTVLPQVMSHLGLRQSQPTILAKAA